MATRDNDLLRRPRSIPGPRLHWIPRIPSIEGTFHSTYFITRILIFPLCQWIAFGVCFWCITSMLQDTAFNFGGLIACRVFLGVFEGLFGTGIVYYLSLWYHRHEMGVRVFWFLGPTAVAG